MKIYGIYDNQCNKYIYIGQTNHFNRRKKEHFETGKLKIDLIIQANPTWYNMILLEDNILDIDINDKEKFWIDYYDTYNNGLNKTIGGKGTPKIDDKMIQSIVRDLKNSELTFSEISQKYDISDSTLWRINTGLTYELNESYPLRPIRMRKISQSDLNQILSLLRNTKLTLKQIGELFGVTDAVINDINQGKTWFNSNNTYPIRKSAGKRTSLTEEDLFQIVDLLQHSQMTQKEISKKFGVSEMIISSINTGKRDYCKKLNINFPIRNRGW